MFNFAPEIYHKSLKSINDNHFENPIFVDVLKKEIINYLKEEFNNYVGRLGTYNKKSFEEVIDFCKQKFPEIISEIKKSEDVISIIKKNLDYNIDLFKSDFNRIYDLAKSIISNSDFDFYEYYLDKFIDVTFYHIDNGYTHFVISALGSSMKKDDSHPELSIITNSPKFTRMFFEYLKNLKQNNLDKYNIIKEELEYRNITTFDSIIKNDNGAQSFSINWYKLCKINGF